MGSWSADLNEAGQWLQIDLGEERLVTKLATQGRPSWSPPQSVTSYKNSCCREQRGHVPRFHVLKTQYIMSRMAGTPPPQ